MKCYKCDGTGFIGGFAHVCGGRCFQCNGSGVLADIKKRNVGYSRVFVHEFLQNSFFYADEHMEKIVCLSSAGHPTAEGWLFKDEDFFYIGQPVCHSSIWYKIPADRFPEFTIHYNKIVSSKIPELQTA